MQEERDTEQQLEDEMITEELRRGKTILPFRSSLFGFTPFVVISVFLAALWGILWWTSPADQKDKVAYICHSTQTESGKNICFR